MYPRAVDVVYRDQDGRTQELTVRFRGEFVEDSLETVRYEDVHGRDYAVPVGTARDGEDAVASYLRRELQPQDAATRLIVDGVRTPEPAGMEAEGDTVQDLLDDDRLR